MTRSRTLAGMTPQEIADLAHLRRACDLMDRDYARPLDVPAMARAALMSPAHFSRKFRAAYGETPYSYLMTRRIERAKALLRQGMSVTDTCFAVGCTSLGSFSSRFTEVVGEAPSQYRARDHRRLEVKGSLQAAIFRSDDLDATFEKLRASGAEVLQEPASQPWGVRDGALRDPSGNVVRIAQG